MALQIPGLSFQSDDQARRIAIEGDPLHPSGTKKPRDVGIIMEASPHRTPTGHSLPSATFPSNSGIGSQTSQTRHVPVSNGQHSPEVAISESSGKEEGELSDAGDEGSSYSLTKDSDEEGAVAIPVSLRPQSSTDVPDLRNSQHNHPVNPMSSLGLHQQQALQIVTILLGHGYPKEQLVQDITGLHKAINLAAQSGQSVPSGPSPVRQSGGGDMLAAQTTGGAPAPSTSGAHAQGALTQTDKTVLAGQPKVHPVAESSKVSEAPTRAFAVQAPEPKPTSHDPDAYKKKLEALRKSKPLLPTKALAAIEKDTLVQSDAQAAAAGKKKVMLDSARLRERLAALKAQNAKPEAVVIPVVSASSGPGSPAAQSASSTNSRNSSLRTARPTASDLISADAVEALISEAREELAFDMSFKSTPGDATDECMVIEVSSSESADEDDALHQPSIGYRDHPQFSESIQSLGGRINGSSKGTEAKKIRTEAEIRAEIDALNASIAARLSKREGSRSATPRTSTGQAVTGERAAPDSFAQNDVEMNEASVLETEPQPTRSASNADVASALAAEEDVPGSIDDDEPNQSDAPMELDSDDDDEDSESSEDDIDDSTSDPADESLPSHPVADAPSRLEEVVSSSDSESGEIDSDESSGDVFNSDADAMDLDSDNDSIVESDHASTQEPKQVQQVLRATAQESAPDHGAIDSEDGNDEEDEDEEDEDEEVDDEDEEEYTPDGTMEVDGGSNAAQSSRSVPHETFGWGTNSRGSGVIIRDESSTPHGALTPLEGRTAVAKTGVKNYLVPFESRVRFGKDQRMDPLQDAHVSYRHGGS